MQLPNETAESFTCKEKKTLDFCLCKSETYLDEIPAFAEMTRMHTVYTGSYYFYED